MWLSTRARITGKAHQRGGLPCQDYAERKITDDCMICILADGASSASLGEVGAAIAVESIKSYFSNISFESLKHMEEEELITELGKCFQKYLQAKSNVLMFEIKSSDFASTAAFIATYEKYDYYVYGIVGDCAIAILEKDKRVRTILKRNKSNLYNRPDFITDSPIRMQVGSGRLSDNYGFIMTSDGCANGGMVSSDNLFSEEVVHIMISNLSCTQNPEIWLEKFLQKNITKYTGDDLSMYVIYNEEYSKYIKEDSSQGRKDIIDNTEGICDSGKSKGVMENIGKKGIFDFGEHKEKGKNKPVKNGDQSEKIMFVCLFLIYVIMIVIMLIVMVNRRIYGVFRL